MLKIKDNVDLKELEKYGFRLIEKIGKYEYYNKAYTIIYVNSWNRVNLANYNCLLLDILKGDNK